MKISKDVALEKLNASGNLFVELFAHGTLSLELYKPVGTDNQKPHDRDEVYIVISGKGEFLCGDQIVPFEKNDFLFVPAGVEHRFLNFTNDFSTWVIFYGPIGGEAPNKNP
jgi:oxalate decarboxylase/phosphoglucose isomerase-like protein (cupin superfamily)